MKHNTNDTKRTRTCRRGAQTKQHEKEKRIRLRTDKTVAAREIVPKASTVTKLHVCATKPSRGPCHAICHLLPTLVNSGTKCHYCRCRAPPSVTKFTKPEQNDQDSWVVVTQVPLIGRTGTLPHSLSFRFFVPQRSRNGFRRSRVGVIRLAGNTLIQTFSLQKNRVFNSNR